MKKFKVIPFTYDEFKSETKNNEYELYLLKRRKQNNIKFHLAVNDEDVDYDNISPVRLAVTIRALRHTADGLTDMLVKKIGIPDDFADDCSLYDFLEKPWRFDEIEQYEVRTDDDEDPEEVFETDRWLDWLKDEIAKEHEADSDALL